MARRHQKWASGDVFLVPLEDEGKRFAVGQVVAPEPRALNSVGIVLGKHDVGTPEEALALTLDESELILMKLTTRESLDRWLWRIIGQKPLAFPIEIYPWHGATTFVGARIYGSGSVRPRERGNRSSFANRYPIGDRQFRHFVIYGCGGRGAIHPSEVASLGADHG